MLNAFTHAVADHGGMMPGRIAKPPGLDMITTASGLQYEDTTPGMGEDQSQFRKIRRVLLRDGLQPRAVMVPGDDFLAFRRVKILQIGFSHGFCAAPFGHFVHYGDRRLGQDAH